MSSDSEMSIVSSSDPMDCDNVAEDVPLLATNIDDEIDYPFDYDTLIDYVKLACLWSYGIFAVTVYLVYFTVNLMTYKSAVCGKWYHSFHCTMEPIITGVLYGLYAGIFWPLVVPILMMSLYVNAS